MNLKNLRSHYLSVEQNFNLSLGMLAVVLSLSIGVSAFLFGTIGKEIGSSGIDERVAVFDKSQHDINVGLSR